MYIHIYTYLHIYTYICIYVYPHIHHGHSSCVHEKSSDQLSRMNHYDPFTIWIYDCTLYKPSHSTEYRTPVC
jgi:hypothetical protein